MPTPTTPNYSIVWNALLVGSSTASVGNVMIPSATVSGRYVVATSANRGTRRSEGIALTAYGGSGTGSINIQQSGTIDASISGLEAGSASWVRCSTTGTIERCTPSGSDDIIGYCEADGRVHLMFGILTASIVNGGGGGGGAPTDATYVTLSTNGTLSDERVLTAGSGISITDAGAGSTVTVAAPAVSAQYVTLATSGDLANERVLTAGTGITVTDAGAGSTVTVAAPGMAASFLTLGTSSDLANERVLTAGTNISFVDGGAGSTLTINASGGGGSSAGTNGQVQASDGSGGFVAIALGAVGSVLRTTGATTAAFGALDLADSDARTGVLPIANVATGTNGQVWTVAGGANVYATITDTNVSASAAIAVTKLATLTNGTFLGAQSGTNQATNRATFFGVGTGTLSTVGGVRYDTTAEVMLGVRNTTNTADVVYFAKDASNNAYVGTSTAFSQQVGNVNVYAATAVALGLGGTTYLYCNASQVQCWQPVAGTSVGSLPFRFASASIAQSGTSDTTLTASQYSCPILICTGAAGGSFNWIAPSTANAVFFVHNQNSSTMTFKRSGGSGVSLSSATSRSMVFHNGSDYAHLIGPVA